MPTPAERTAQEIVAQKRLILLAMTVEQMWQEASESEHSRQQLCPHRKTTFRGRTSHSGQLTASEADDGCGPADLDPAATGTGSGLFCATVGEVAPVINQYVNCFLRLFYNTVLHIVDVFDCLGWCTSKRTPTGYFNFFLYPLLTAVTLRDALAARQAGDSMSARIEGERYRSFAALEAISIRR